MRRRGDLDLAFVVDPDRVDTDRRPGDVTYKPLEGRTILGFKPVVLAEASLYDACEDGIAFDGPDLIVTDCGNGSYAGRILRVPRAGGPPKALAAKDVYKPCNPAVDERAIFWTTTTIATSRALFSGGAVLRIPKARGGR